MQRCQKMVDVGRRHFLRGASLMAAGTAVATIAPPESKAAVETGARVTYPSNRLGNVSDLKPNEPLTVN